jgi:hypothetical protein
MTTTDSTSVWDTLDHASLKQRRVLRFLTATLDDLVVLNLFVQFLPRYVAVDAFTTTLLAAVVLQVLLKLTLVLEHRLAAFFNARPGGFGKFMRYFTAWLVLFGSKFLILEVLSLALGERLHFGGAFHGIVALIAVVVAMLVAELLLVKGYRWLG